MLWKKIRTGTMFVIAFIACPCHLPITLPLLLAILAGSPLAVWIAQHKGWLYGIMAVVFIASLAFGFSWIGSSKKYAKPVSTPKP